MIGSPNYGFFVYDGDLYGAASSEIERTFETYYADLGLPTTEVNIVGSSDHTAFLEAGIPSGGLFSGAGGIKNAAQVALWGGTAGQAFDPCYHQACDTFANVSEYALGINADAVAYAMFHFATNGVVPARGRVPVLPAPAKADEHAPVFK
jgi:Zn-dependent M28 family amino/carboxypeptidase